MIYSDNMNADRLIEFLQQLIKNADRKILLIFDNLKIFHYHIVKEWSKQEKIKQKIEVLWLQPYSLKHNPGEYPNCDLKRSLSDKLAPKNERKLRESIENHMSMLQQNPDRIATYFTRLHQICYRKL